MTGQPEGDPGPLAELALGRDPPAVELDELADDAQTQAQPALLEAEVARGMAAGVELGEERLEHLAERPGLDADPPVGHDDLGLVGRGQAGRERDLAAVGGELDGVGEQVEHRVADLGGVELEVAEVVGQVEDQPMAPGGDERLDPRRRP